MLLMADGASVVDSVDTSAGLDGTSVDVDGLADTTTSAGEVRADTIPSHRTLRCQRELITEDGEQDS